MLSSKKKNRKKTRKKKPSPLLLPPTTQSTQIPDLPDDLLLSCFARVSRLHYPTLSLVSKRFRSLLASPELYKTRSLLGHTESCLYVYLRFYSDPNNLCWFTLCRRPNRNLTKTKKKQSSHLLVPITSPHSTPPFSSYTAVGSDIYEIGGHISGMASSTVSVFDCRSHTWHKSPSMQVRRINPDVKAIDGKIYVKGNIDYPNSDLVEVFDPKTQTWTYETNEWESLDGYYKSKEYISRSCLCEIDNVLYYNDRGVFKWLDTKVGYWRLLKGLSPNFLSYLETSSLVHLADYGGKMAVLWDRLDHSSKCKERNVWCAVIALERLSSDEIWGTLEWSEVVLKVPKSIQFVDVLSATV
ncbi:unnamed protein product [Microthlaspi erraticum]|uniref:F-box domain-containing protein n=1 Tax=Microthlaspi erraticum TaxID=1685480 RepID=A0A6D2J3F8_9BRAS|nr:unnamed protein product [Microthlaspi erraticum]